MPLEIERRFLITQVPMHLIQQVGFESIQQQYLADTGEWVMRLRMVSRPRLPDRYWLTLKRPAGGCSSHEIETEVSSCVFASLQAHAGPALRKKRFYIPHHDGLMIELDQFFNVDGAPGLWIAEVELPHADHPLILPDWFGREITGERGFSNFALAQRVRAE